MKHRRKKHSVRNRFIPYRPIRFFITIFVLIAIALTISATVLVLADAQISENYQKTEVNIPIPDASAATAPPAVGATSAVLIDGYSGRIIYEKDSHRRLPMASTTKMMTAILVRENAELDDIVTVTEEATAAGEQEIWLEKGETLQVEQLLAALLIHSANDAGVALAEHVAGDVAGFVDMMNQKAAEIGARDTHFANPHGIDQEDHYSTSYDLALIGMDLIKDDVLAEMVKRSRYEIPWPGNPYARVCLSHNRLLGQYSHAVGIKTGYTGKAGYCLVSAARKDGKLLIATVLDSTTRFDDSRRLLEYGFQVTQRVILMEEGKKLGRTRVSTFPRRYVDAYCPREIVVLAIIGRDTTYRVETLIKSKTSKSVKKEDVLGEIRFFRDNELLESEKACAGTSREKPRGLAVVIAFIWYVICGMGRILAAPF